MNQGDAVLQNVFDATWGTSSPSIAKIGQLNPDQANTFIDYIFDQTVLTKVARIIRMNAPQARVGKVGIGDKPLMPAQRGIDPGVTSTSSTSEINLSVKEMIAEAKILDDELEDNTEKGAFMDHFMRMLGIKIGNQLELAYLTGQLLSGQQAQDINQLFNGWEYQLQNNGGHLVDATTYPNRFLSTTALNKLIKVVPPKYRTRVMDYRFLVSPNTYQDFLALVGNRATPLGDVAFQAHGYEQNLPNGNSVLGWGNIPLYVVPLLPESDFVVQTASPASTTISSGGAAGTNQVTVASVTGLATGNVVRVDTGALTEVCTITGIASTTLTVNVLTSQTGSFLYNHASAQPVVLGTADGAKILLTHAQNLVIGIQRDIRIELDRRPRERATYAVVTLRSDVAMENPDAGAMLQNLAIQP